MNIHTLLLDQVIPLEDIYFYKVFEKKLFRYTLNTEIK